MKVTEKSDVYSFGVVLLEIVTGRKPVDPSFTEAVDLVGWVHHQVRAGIGDRTILDPRLDGLPESHLRQVEELLGIALLCVTSSPNERPTMREIEREGGLLGFQHGCGGAEERDDDVGRLVYGEISPVSQ